MIRSQRRIDRVEFSCVVGTQIARRLHAGKQHRDMSGSKLLQNGRQGFPGERGVETAQCVVRAELENDPIGAVRYRPVEPFEPAGRGVARHACIHHARVDPFRLQRCLQLRRKGVLRWQPVAGGERIPERNDLHRFLRRCGGEQTHHRDQDGRDALDPSGAAPI